MTNSKFKLGDKVILREDSEYYGMDGSSQLCGEGEIIQIHSDSYSVEWKYKDDWCRNSYQAHDLKLTNNLTKTNMNLMQKFILAMKDEPEKTFIKQGIMTEDGVLTDDGKDLYLNWLFQQDAEDFNTQVVDLILDDEEFTVTL